MPSNGGCSSSPHPGIFGSSGPRPQQSHPSNPQSLTAPSSEMDLESVWLIVLLLVYLSWWKWKGKFSMEYMLEYLFVYCSMLLFDEASPPRRVGTIACSILAPLIFHASGYLDFLIASLYDGFLGAGPVRPGQSEHPEIVVDNENAHDFMSHQAVRPEPRRANESRLLEELNQMFRSQPPHERAERMELLELELKLLKNVQKESMRNCRHPRQGLRVAPDPLPLRENGRGRGFRDDHDIFY
ncbi:hypothetical protein BDV95DRAFT_287728 [Massariosphaeria phaeospora]|uniref:Uncharacterized protein n=1 Tax=Massariosphaeria phaeospora TaxID=100035 RepID=A0A7C8IFL6_9PLEO|nr:hypothetical protein BDV95DRAFT_287728 [Massariosphaeria phaeospora]